MVSMSNEIAITGQEEEPESGEPLSVEGAQTGGG